MKTRSFLAFGSILSLAYAFPSAMNAPSISIEDQLRAAKASLKPSPTVPFYQRSALPGVVDISRAETNCGPVPCLVFDGQEQYVSTTGQHAYQSPSVDDIRGPCPGLNAAANHAYIPRNGVLTIPQAVTGLAAAFGMSADFAAFLSAYAIVIDGDIVDETWSIGGPQTPSANLGGVLGSPQGISYSHSKYESDVSIGRFDAYINNGDAHSLDVNRFKSAYEVGMENSDRYTLDLFRQNFGQKIDESIQQNPWFFSAPFAGSLVAPAAFNFVINFMSNHSKDEPNGYLNGDIFKQFFAVEGDYPNFTWNRGQERIPDNWYRRTSLVQYNVNFGFDDVEIGALAYPHNLRIGGNTGQVNTYKGADLSLLSKGTYTDDTLFQGDNFRCFLLESINQALPDQLGGSNSGLIAKAVDLMKQATAPILGNLTCPQLAGYDGTAFNGFPGAGYQPKGPTQNY